MKKQLMLLLSLTTAAGALYAQNVDTVSSSQTDTLLLSDAAKALSEVKITAQRPLYSVDGEKQVYNTEDDASVQTGTASDALQNALGVEVDAEGNISLRGSQDVEIWINDRPSNLSGESLRQYIKTLPANSISRIEVITNPSARYGGGGPVVNIVTTKKILRNEFLSLGVTGNHRPQVSPWLSYVYSNKRLSINAYIEYDYSHTWSKGTYEGVFFTPQGDTSAIKSYSSRNDNYRHGGYLYVGGHYDFDTLRTLSFWGGTCPTALSYQGTVDMQWRELIYAPGDYSYHTSSASRTPQLSYFGGLDYSHRFDDEGQMLWVRTYLSNYTYRSEDTLQRNYLHQPDLDYTIQFRGLNNRGISSSVDIGYTLPFAEQWELVVGATGSYRFPSSSINTYDSLPSMRRDTLRSYSQTDWKGDYSGYATLMRRFGNFSAKVGLRLGQTIGASTYTGYITDETSINKFIPNPSIHLSYHTSNMHNFSLSYTYRTSVPSAADLTRFVEFRFDNYSLGNPDLQPSHTHNIEGGWNKYIENFGTIGVEAYYKAFIDEVWTLSDVAYHPLYGRVVSYSQPFNIGSSHVAGADFNLTYRPTAMFNLRLSARAGHVAYHSQFRPGEWASDQMWCANLRLNVWAKLWNVLQVFGNVDYTSEKVSGFLSRMKPVFKTDIGISTDLMDRRLSLYLNVKDIFASYTQSAVSTNPYNSNNSSNSYSSRYISFGVTLRLGKMELESQARSHEIQ